MTFISGFPPRLRAAALALVAAVLVAGCGGGSGEPSPPTALPQTLSLELPRVARDLATPVAFSANVADPDRALVYAWAFGDGATSRSAAPEHTYAKPGEYRVTLTVTNEAGESRTAAGMVRVADLAIVAGKACSGSAATGWCWQRPLPQGNVINDTVFVDGLRGWAVGEAGTILATTDGGATWKAQASGTRSSLVKVTFADAQVGWAAGSHGEMLRTLDGGATWQSFSLGRSEHIRGLGATDGTNAWVTTWNGAFATTDGGVHWQRLFEAPWSMQLLAVSSVTDLWAMGYASGQWNVIRSTDRGLTWTPAGIPPPESGVSRYATRMQFTTPRLGILWAEEWAYIGSRSGRRSVAWQTSDAGASWQRLDLSTAGSSTDSTTVQPAGANAAFALTNGSSSLRRTTDLGATWETIPLPRVNGYWSTFRVYSTTHLTVTDGTGRMYATTDAGATWADRSAGPVSLPTVGSVWFFDSREGLALASDGSSVRTTDGGESWTTTAPLNRSQGWHSMQFSGSGNVGWVAAASSIYRSTDRGRTWLAPAGETSAQLPHDVSDFHFVDETNGWALARSWWSSDSPLFRSRDGGMSWQPVRNSRVIAGASAIRFADALNGVAAGDAGIAWVTADGGETWTARPTGIGSALLRLAFADATTVVGVGARGAIVRSTDRGINWTRIGLSSDLDLNDVRFVNASVGYAAGGAGTLLKTVDGGLTWAVQAVPTNRTLRSVFFLDEQTGWAAGDGGAVLATATGGR